MLAKRPFSSYIAFFTPLPVLFHASHANNTKYAAFAVKVTSRITANERERLIALYHAPRDILLIFIDDIILK